jgi:uncharacterized membrane protein
VGVARAATVVPIAPQEAYELWTDVSRWPTFIDGFGRADRVDGAWPEQGAKLIWKSVPGGRGTVTERVAKALPGALHEVLVFEERLNGTQTITFSPHDEGTSVELQLDYKVSVGGPLRPIVDTFFIRRAQSDALGRTLRRFRTEAAEQASL